MYEYSEPAVGCPECGRSMRRNGDQYTCEVCGHCGEQGVIHFGKKKQKTEVEQMTLFDFLEESSEQDEVSVSQESALLIETHGKRAPLPGRKSVLERETVPKDFDGIKIGSVCEIVVEDPRKEKLPHLYKETQVGRRIIVTELRSDRGKRWVWGYQARLRKSLPAGEKRAKRLQYDPACSTAPYPAEWLLLLDQDAAKLTKQLIQE